MTDEFEPQPGFHVFGGDNINAESYVDPEPIKWLTGTKYMVELPEDFKEHAQIKRWCELNCKDVVAYFASLRYADEIYFFLETDAVAFKLRWL